MKDGVVCGEGGWARRIFRWDGNVWGVVERLAMD